MPPSRNPDPAEARSARGGSRRADAAAGAAAAGIGTDSGGDPYLPASGNGGYRVIRYELDLDYRIRNNHLDATAVISAQATQALTRFSLDLVGLQVERVMVNGVRAAKVAQMVGKVAITPATRLVAGENFTVTVRYIGRPHSARSAWGEVGWEELDDGVLVAGQPSGAPTWFPCDDRPNAKATFLVRVACDSQYRPVANGRLLSRSVRSTRTAWTYETVEPMAPYLATLQIGRYDERMISGGRIPQHLYYPRDHAESVGDDFRDQPRMMDAFEKLFGPYPFYNYSVIVTDDELEIPLEAHGMAIFGRNHIDGADGSERLIAHELAHQWFGNSVTAESWQHIWLHEGFACYAEWLWSEAKGGGSADSLARMHWARVDKLPKDLVIGNPGPAMMFDDRVYKRGALTLHALRLTIGRKAFVALLRGWTAEHRFGAVTTADFVDHAERSSKVPVRELLHAWLDLPELPRLPGPK